MSSGTIVTTIATNVTGPPPNLCYSVDVKVDAENTSGKPPDQRSIPWTTMIKSGLEQLSSTRRHCGPTNNTETEKGGWTEQVQSLVMQWRKEHEFTDHHVTSLDYKSAIDPKFTLNAVQLLHGQAEDVIKKKTHSRMSGDTEYKTVPEHLKKDGVDEEAIQLEGAIHVFSEVDALLKARG